MKEPEFRPGFRFSPMDGAVLVLGAVGSFVAWRYSPELSILGGAAVLHFFLFCNVFRVARIPELVWSGIYVGCACLRVFLHVEWLLIVGIVSASTVLLIRRETRKESYHGVLWQWLNPDLRAWWSRQRD